MKLIKTTIVCCSTIILTFICMFTGVSHAELDQETSKMVTLLKQGLDVDYHRAVWAPIHFSPAINQATNEDCLQCHQEIIERRPLQSSPGGFKTDEMLAWYQTLNTYQGEQDTFHRRHLLGPTASQLMNLQCTTCHQGNDPRDETVGSSADGPVAVVQRKMVNPKTCLMCHGQFPWQVMTGLTSPWNESGKIFGNSCIVCHAAFRTNRHQVNYLKPDAIEAAGSINGDSCYGCHGGRAWYRISYPYPRHAWPGMNKTTPEWAKDRPVQSEQRFLRQQNEHGRPANTE